MVNQTDRQCAIAEQTLVFLQKNELVRHTASGRVFENFDKLIGKTLAGKQHSFTALSYFGQIPASDVASFVNGKDAVLRKADPDSCIAKGAARQHIMLPHVVYGIKRTTAKRRYHDIVHIFNITYPP